MLFCAFFFVHLWHLFSSDQPVSKSRFGTQPPSTKNFLATSRCFSVHSSFVFLSSIARAGSSQETLLQFFVLVLCCTLLPDDCPGLLHEHLLHVFWANVSHVNSCFAFEYQGVPPWPLTCLNHRSRTSLLLQACLSPCLRFDDLLPPRLLLLSFPSSHPHTLYPKVPGHSG